MGIPGLLPLLKPITRDKHIKEYSGMKAAVDGLCWLHRAINSADESDMTKYISICMYLINLLLSNGVRPIVVFDGMSLPAKSATNEKRRVIREQCLLKMIEAEKNGFYSDADRYRRQSMVVGDEAVQAFITALRGANVDYIVAPYEADAQLAFMSLRNLVDVVITEDSDCLVYGCRRILFKMDSTGRGQEICRRDLGENKSPDFEGWTDEQFKLFCCLAGCDYVPRIPSVGIKTAHKIAAGCPSFCDVTRYLGRHKPSHCDTTYFRELARAVLTFHHQIVYNPESRNMEHLLPISPRRSHALLEALAAFDSQPHGDGDVNSSLGRDPLSVLADRGGGVVSGVATRHHDDVLSRVDLSFLGYIFPSEDAVALAAGRGLAAAPEEVTQAMGEAQELYGEDGDPDPSRSTLQAPINSILYSDMQAIQHSAPPLAKEQVYNRIPFNQRRDVCDGVAYSTQKEPLVPLEHMPALHSSSDRADAPNQFVDTDVGKPSAMAEEPKRKSKAKLTRSNAIDPMAFLRRNLMVHSGVSPPVKLLKPRVFDVLQLPSSTRSETQMHVLGVAREACGVTFSDENVNFQESISGDKPSVDGICDDWLDEFRDGRANNEGQYDGSDPSDSACGSFVGCRSRASLQRHSSVSERRDGLGLNSTTAQYMGVTRSSGVGYDQGAAPVRAPLEATATRAINSRSNLFSTGLTHLFRGPATTSAPSCYSNGDTYGLYSGDKIYCSGSEGVHMDADVAITGGARKRSRHLVALSDVSSEPPTEAEVLQQIAMIMQPDVVHSKNPCHASSSLGGRSSSSISASGSSSADMTSAIMPPPNGDGAVGMGIWNDLHRPL